MRCLLQSAAVHLFSFGIQHGVALLIAWPSAFGKRVPAFHLVVAAPRLGGLGRQLSFQASAVPMDAAFVQPEVLKPLHQNFMVRGARYRGGRALPPTGLGPTSTVHRKCKGQHADAG